MLGILPYIPLLFGILTQTPYSDENGGPEKRKSFSAVIQKKVGYDYLLNLPMNYSDMGKYPLLLFLHGAGERGSDLERVKIHGPLKSQGAHRNYQFIIISPQVPTGDIWDADALAALLDEVIREYPVDTTRVYVTGLSMGGYGTWDVISHYPEKFAAAVPICGWGNRQIIHKAKKIPVWAFHGARDNVVPLPRSEEMVNALNSGGGNARLTIYPEATHDAWTETYNNPEIYDWLMQHVIVK
jgi:predicted peptidase